jgi:hypothetical protein
MGPFVGDVPGMNRHNAQHTPKQNGIFVVTVFGLQINNRAVVASFA